MPYRTIDLSQVRTYPLPQRSNLVALENLVTPSQPVPPFANPELTEVAERIVAARQAGRPVIWMMGAHVVKRGLSPLLIDLMERGVVTHLAGNGAVTIHDFEIALQGHTSEDVARSIEHGTFGMAEETGAIMNRAIRAGARDGLGIGEALGRCIAQDERFRFREYSLLYNAYRLGVPLTVHVAIGTDIIHQHPLADFAALGWGSGQDFKIFTASVSELEGGVFCNFGSAVIGPEVFLKALSIVRNQGYTVEVFTTANFDLIPLGDYRQPVGDDVPEYYYRPRKNIVNRPVSLGGKGYHIVGDHRVTIPNVRHLVVRRLDRVPSASQRTSVATEWPAVVQSLEQSAPAAASVLRRTMERAPQLVGTASALAQAFSTLSRCFVTGGTLFVGGNGGSMADALHISGELNKSFLHPRPIPAAHRQRFSELPGGEELAEYLQQGMRTVVLGTNPSLTTAVSNDISLPHVGLAQELYVLAHPGDVFLGISTSGNAQNIRYAATVARTLGLSVIALTGEQGGRLSGQADVGIKAPATDTAEIQNLHVQIYHVLCEMLEAQLFGEGEG
jgi:phosphoheptose isomerase